MKALKRLKIQKFKFSTINAAKKWQKLRLALIADIIPAAAAAASVAIQ